MRATSEGALEACCARMLCCRYSPRRLRSSVKLELRDLDFDVVLEALMTARVQRVGRVNKCHQKISRRAQHESNPRPCLFATSSMVAMTCLSTPRSKPITGNKPFPNLRCVFLGVTQLPPHRGRVVSIFVAHGCRARLDPSCAVYASASTPPHVTVLRPSVHARTPQGRPCLCRPKWREHPQTVQRLGSVVSCSFQPRGGRHGHANGGVGNHGGNEKDFWFPFLGVELRC